MNFGKKLVLAGLLMAAMFCSVSAMAEETRVSRPIWDQMTEKLGRGIANIAVIVKAVADFCKEQGAEPFIIPAMGSHGGATAQGQAAVLAVWGLWQRRGATDTAVLQASMGAAGRHGTAMREVRAVPPADERAAAGRVPQRDAVPVQPWRMGELNVESFQS